MCQFVHYKQNSLNKIYNDTQRLKNEESRATLGALITFVQIVSCLYFILK
jgi:hypothetical protein